MKEFFLGISLTFLLFISPRVWGISISSDEWTGDRGYVRLHRLHKRQNSQSSIESHPNSDNTSASVENTEMWYDQQCIDHSLDCTQKSNQWSQRYWISMTNYQPGGPIFMYLGGETSVSGWANSGSWNYYAQQYNAATITVEHRFYGQSFPTPQSNRSPEAMKVLTSRQALHDYAKILTWLKDKNNLKVVAFGGSYPGFLTAWFRALYPDLVKVAVASSAPLNYTFEFPEFVGKTSEVVQQNKPDCFNQLKSTFQCMQGIIDGSGCSSNLSNVTIDNLTSITNLCLSLDTEIDMENFFTRGGRGVWASSNPGTSLLIPNGTLCDILTGENGGDLVKSYGQFIASSNNTIACNQRKKRQTAAEDEGGYLYSWYWQSCNEFVNFQVADPVLGMLGTNWGRNTEVYACSYYYPNAGFDEETIRKNVARTTEQYPPGKGYNGTCSIFTNGSWDPWGTKGFTNTTDTSDKNSVYYIPNGEHMDDFFYPNTNPYANSSIMNVQQMVMTQIGVYLNDPSC